MITLSRPRAIAAVAVTAAAIAAATAGCTPLDSIASSGAGPTASTASTASSPAASPTGHHGHRGDRHPHTPSSSPTSTKPSPPPPGSSPTPTSSRPAPTQTSSPRPSPTSTTPAASSGSAACVTSQAKFNCGPFHYPQIAGAPSDPTVGNNVWNPIPGWHQTLYANNPGDWSVVANMPAGNTAVVSYPSSQTLFNDKSLSDFRQLTSSFTETMNANSGTSGWSMYDIWLDNAGKVDEVMVQHDFARNGACGPDASMTFNGQSWYLCNFGNSVAIKLKGDESSGTVDLLAMFNWLKDHGYITSSAQLGAIDYGWEIASTGGQSEKFTVSRYTISAA